MTRVLPKYQKNVGAFSLASAGVLFMLYPAIRPFSDESTLQGAKAFSSTEWMTSHMLAMIAFTLLLIGFASLHLYFKETNLEATNYWAFILSIVGVGFTLPFYGGETYGLNAIGQEAIAKQDEGLVGLGDVVRSGPGLVMFGIGLIILAIAAIVQAVVIWKSRRFSKWSGVPIAIGMLLYLPQFMASQPIRVLHGLVITIGCFWLAVELIRNRKEE